MKERPMLFNGPMVRAILSGQKTVTRRVVKPQYESENFTVRQANAPRHDGHSHDWWLPTGTQPYAALPRCPYGQPGDRLWVREAWAEIYVAQAPGEKWVVYRECDNRTDYGGPWKPSIHMRRRDSRILLEISAVRVERLQDGEGETAYESRYVAEGINRIHHGDGEYYYHAFQNEPGPGNWVDPFDAWRELWVSVNGAESWAANPWVWVIEFKQVAP